MDSDIRKAVFAAFAQWQKLSVEWIYKTLGKPEFVDKSNSKMAAILKELGI